jgi:hypothetical protein
LSLNGEFIIFCNSSHLKQFSTLAFQRHLAHFLPTEGRTVHTATSQEVHEAKAAAGRAHEGVQARTVKRLAQKQFGKHNCYQQPCQFFLHKLLQIKMSQIFNK